MAADVRLMKTAAELALADAFAAVKSTLPGDAAVAAQRTAAFETFASVGLPHRRVESWRYTDLRALLREAPPLASAAGPEALARSLAACPMLAGMEARRIYVVNGAFVSDISDLANLEPGVSISSLATALGAADPLVAHLGQTVASSDAALALNTAFMGDGVVIALAEGATLSRPLHLVFVTTEATATAAYTRSLLVMGKGASAQVIESHEGPAGAAYQVNTALEVVVGEGASLERVKITAEGNDALHISTLLARVADGAKLANANFTLGGAIIRNQLLVQLAGEGIDASLSGVSLLAGKQHSDTLLAVEHIAPNCQSREQFRTVVDDTARDIFQGRISVRQSAQKTDARMMSRALLLSDTAESDNKPELEIFADDVQCGHGCTTGSLDQQLKFYMMSRGIPEKEAEALLIQAFVGEVIDAIGHEGVRAALTDATRNWLIERK
ncbi:Fe-S cluster assembly protein SufD [Xanthobacter agilis]|uniref:Fe-S cluster assembly protein SufD n=1 Tax=Xanthobacter agilis TaxID=47492 RepID=A0ABU0L919_XANAG|nr:Fe-S cluster assembly protein SufD [Xanthobacter agilis]MDQ0503652.1 Fe-S cluster assembly protein SufD [Xanthobacter agilis]